MDSSYGIGIYSDQFVEVNNELVISQRVCIYAHLTGNLSFSDAQTGDVQVDYVRRSWFNIIGEENWILQNRTIEFEMTITTFGSFDIDKSVSI